MVAEAWVPIHLLARYGKYNRKQGHNHTLRAKMGVPESHKWPLGQGLSTPDLTQYKAGSYIFKRTSILTPMLIFLKKFRVDRSDNY